MEEGVNLKHVLNTTMKVQVMELNGMNGIEKTLWKMSVGKLWLKI
jgi:hypothetical protein